jgi:RNA polymerase sigma-70 factor (ECF subfamily)
VDREVLEVVAAADDPAEAVAARVASADAVARVIRILRPEQAEIVLLRVVADLTVEEVAAIVGKSTSAVRVIQHRALRRLAGQLRGNGVTPPPGSGM